MIRGEAIGPEPGAIAVEQARERLVAALGPDGVLSAFEDRASYAFDAFTESSAPDLVALPRDTRDVCAIVRVAKECRLPIVPRGAGTGLCGGAVPVAGGIVVSFARMDRILALDTRRRRARVQPGAINLSLSSAARPHGLFFGPDPSSQKISTLGGNAATNAGGPHAFSYGSMTDHVLGLEFVDGDGEVHALTNDDVGYDLAAVLVGSEGTLGIITALDLRLMRVPSAVAVCVAAFGDVEAASTAVSAIVAAALSPTALEIMDRTIVRAVEAHYGAGYPLDAGAVLLVEIAGEVADVREREAAIRTIALAHGAMTWRTAANPREREHVWAARKGAAGAIGRIAPNYYIQDACVPRTRLPEALARVDAIAEDCGLRVGNVFHAGDGNLHPLLMFDRREPAQVDAVFEAGDNILAACIELGGTISGEHGIGFEKRDALTRVYSANDLAAMGRVRDAFDPMRAFNPEKIFPRGASCAETRARTQLEQTPA
jgi:glycolate oxidase